METNLVSRASVNKTAKALEEKIYANGGHEIAEEIKRRGC